MGQHDVFEEVNESQQRRYMKALLDDVRALERMIELGLVETGVRRIGAEQEFFLVDRDLSPAPIAESVLDYCQERRLTTEIGRFNLEANLTPRLWGGDCLSVMHRELDDLIEQVREGAHVNNGEVLLAGILPTLRRSDLTLANISPCSRYLELNRAVSKLRGGAFSIHIKGIDELQMSHDNIMMESCNTSFQLHLQVDPDEFVPLYNLSQAITAPVLAAAVNSPLLFGQRLWQETRLALFQHSADTRSNAMLNRSQPTRVGFGDHWLKGSILELFREQIARFRVIMVGEVDEDPMPVLDRGEIPHLAALRLHNGTVWPWNRACYGTDQGRPHLRIENRALPSGPTTIDEMANAAFYFGLMSALPGEYGPVSERLEFADAKANFYAAARYGLNAQFTWLDKRNYTAAALIMEQLLPLAHIGLKQYGIVAADRDRYLGVLQDRVESGQTGAQWVLGSLSALGDRGTPDIRMRSLTHRMMEQQHRGKPAHTWPLIEMDDTDDWRRSYQTVGQFMTTDLFTVRPDDLLDLAASMMDWKHVRHVPVEDNAGRLVGLVSHRSLLHHLVSSGKNGHAVPVSAVMKANPVTVGPATPTMDAIRLMQQHNVGCLPVVEAGQLVGIVTAYDFLAASAKLFELYLTPVAEAH